jgi:hypothetical protein
LENKKELVLIGPKKRQDEVFDLRFEQIISKKYWLLPMPYRYILPTAIFLVL